MPGPIDLQDFNPNNPATQIALLAMRVDNLGKEKEDLERRNAGLEARIQKLENSFSPEKIVEINTAIEFMSNSSFLTKWVVRAIGAIFATTVTTLGVYFTWKSK